ADLVPGDVRQPQLPAEGHRPLAGLHVAEAHAARDHLEQGVAGRDLRLRDVDDPQRFPVRGDGHRPHQRPSAPVGGSPVPPAVPTDAISSISTGMFPGSTVVPIAARAWIPRSPNACPRSSDAPSITPDVSVNPGAQFTKPSSLTMRSTRSSDPIAAR